MSTAPVPGSAEWNRYMTASKIAAVVGTSPYESRFSLWHKMAGNVPTGHVTDNPIFNYGHYLEPVLLKWFGDQHPELTVSPGEWVEKDGWAGATPDGNAYGQTKRDRALIECKTGRLSWEWDDGVPPGYVDQCQWALWVTGERVCYVVADVAMEFREYRVDRDDDRIAHLVAEGRAFMDSLAAGDAPPLDGSMHTYVAVRQLHPDISPEDAEIPPVMAWAWLTAREALATTTETEQAAKNAIADFMGDARRATWDGHVLFTRQARKDGTPYLVAGRNLPTNLEGTAA